MSQYIRQRDNNDGGIVNIGYFSAWSGTTNAITMTYVHGDKCEKGRDRSITVIFHCGNDNKIVAVRESFYFLKYIIDLIYSSFHLYFPYFTYNMRNNFVLEISFIFQMPSDLIDRLVVWVV
jgi:hypothetical protein